MRSFLCLLTLLLLAPLPARAAETDSGCPDPDRKATKPALPKTADTAADDTGDVPPAVKVRADRVQLDEKRIATFEGNVQLEQNGQSIQADQLRYEKDSGAISASGSVELKTRRGDRFTTPALDYNLDSSKGKTGKVDYTLAEGGRGSAADLQFLGREQLRLQDVRYTTCPPDDDSWYLNIGELEIDKQTDLGVARHATVHLKGIPLFYWPYVDFPVSGQRKSGFLAPELGYSDKNGAHAGLPYYFNLHPQMDDTFIPRYLSERGWQIQNEFRYLARGLRGSIEGEVLPKDKIDNDTRAAARLEHTQQLGTGGYVLLNAQWISDPLYLEDFGNQLAITSQTHLPRHLQTGYSNRYIDLNMDALSYQAIDTSIAITDTPYDILPRLRLRNARSSKPGRLHMDYEAEWTRFERDQSIQGSRSLLAVEASLPWRNAWAFAIPTAGVRYWSYDLADTPSVLRPAGFDENPSQHVPWGSIDLGLYFDRDTSWSDRKLRHSLEPRLFYLYAEARDQNDLPLFDTQLPDFGFDRLFASNRFVGGDRVGDADQLAAALTTRITDSNSGQELWRASIGMIQHYRDRTVNLTSVVDTRPQSQLAAETRLLVANAVYLRAAALWDKERERVSQGVLHSQYNPDPWHIVDVAYRVIDNEDRQVDAGMEWRLGNSPWTVSARSRYSLEASTNIETLGGLAYRSCCWTLRLFSNRRLRSDGSQSSSTQLQLELAGFSQIGAGSDSPLRDALFHPAGETHR